MRILDAKDLNKSFSGDELVVDSVNLAVDEGEIVCLLGPSGCGKTTLLRLIAGLETPDRGEVWFAGKNLRGVPPYKRDFGMMFQDFALFPHKNVFENIAFGLQMHGQNPDEIEQKVGQMLDLVDLEGFGERTIEQLSGGEQQRVALARSLAPSPRLLMLDEPLGALDRALRERLMLEVREILKNVGVTAIYVTHDQAESFAIADRLAVMNGGKIEQLDRPEVIFRKPATPFIANFLGFINIIEGNLAASGVVKTSIGNFQLDNISGKSSGTISLLIKPDAAVIINTQEYGSVNEIAGIIKIVSFRGRYYQVWLAVLEELLMFEMPEPPGEVGDLVHFKIDGSAIQILPA